MILYYNNPITPAKKGCFILAGKASNKIITDGAKFLFAVIIACLLLSQVVPVWASEENSYIENSQLLILAGGIFMVVYAAQNPLLEKRQIKLLYLSVPVWLIMIGREVSWGRTLIIDPGTGDFISRSNLWYWPLVYPLLAVTIIVTLYSMYKAGILKEVSFWFANRKTLAIPVCILLLSVTGLTVFEKNIIKNVSGRNQVYEELSEVVMYFSLLAICWDLYIAPYRDKSK